MMACVLCDDTGWVCENHFDQPWDGPHGCACDGAAAPCPRCNGENMVDDPPRRPKQFKADGEK